MRRDYLFFTSFFILSGFLLAEFSSGTEIKHSRGLDKKLNITLSRLQNERRETYRLESHWLQKNLDISESLASQKRELKLLETAIDFQKKKQELYQEKIKNLKDSLKQRGLSQKSIPASLEKAKASLINLIEQRNLRTGESPERSPAQLKKSKLGLHEQFQKLWKELLDELQRSSRSTLRSGVVHKKNRELAVEFLDIGSVQHYYRTKKAGEYALWVKKLDHGFWQVIENADWKQSLDRTYEILRKQRTPEFVQLPINIRWDSAK